MVDPITAAIGGISALAGSTPSWLPWVGAAASAGTAAGSLLSSKSGAAPQINIPAPPGVAPAQAPTMKPQRKSMQQSFLSGAAMAQQSGAGGTGTGKTLLGA